MDEVSLPELSPIIIVPNPEMPLPDAIAMAGICKFINGHIPIINRDRTHNLVVPLERVIQSGVIPDSGEVIDVGLAVETILDLAIDPYLN